MLMKVNKFLTKKYKQVILKIEDEDNAMDDIIKNINTLNLNNENNIKNSIERSPNDIFIESIDNQKQKEEMADIWKDSPYKDLVKLQSNNVGNVGEMFIQKLCDICDIQAEVDGSKTKNFGGGMGDGIILNKSVEIKTSHKGCNTPNFQHELGETPWKPEFMIFIDVSPSLAKFAEQLRSKFLGFK